jgi:hypothetical protein
MHSRFHKKIRIYTSYGLSILLFDLTVDYG